MRPSSRRASAGASARRAASQPDVTRPSGCAIAPPVALIEAVAAAKALMENTELSARAVVERALKIAGDICIYTNHNVSIEELEA